MEIQTTQETRKLLLIELLGAMLTLIGDLLIGYVKFSEGVGMLEGYFAAALALPVWRPILGGLIGFLGISLEFLGRLSGNRGRRSASALRRVYVALSFGHRPDAAGQAVRYDIALQYVLYFILPATVVFYVFFAGSSIVQFIRGTPLPKWYACSTF